EGCRTSCVGEGRGGGPCARGRRRWPWSARGRGEGHCQRRRRYPPRQHFGETFCGCESWFRSFCEYWERGGLSQRALPHAQWTDKRFGLPWAFFCSAIVRPSTVIRARGPFHSDRSQDDGWARGVTDSAQSSAYTPRGYMDKA